MTARRATILDYGPGNLHSLGRALTHLRLDVRVEADVTACLERTDVLVLPGVGAFGPAAARLAPARLAIRDALAAGQPCVGICLGMQLLFEGSDEGEGEGLGLLAGRVTRLRTARCPHIGWTAVDGLSEMYFAHSYVAAPVALDSVRAWAEHGGQRFPAIVGQKRTIGVQFHPEKSGQAGLQLLARSIEEVLA